MSNGILTITLPKTEAVKQGISLNKLTTLKGGYTYVTRTMESKLAN